VLRSVVTIGLLAYVLSKADLRESLQVVSSARLLPLALASGAFVIQIVVGATRWKMLLRSVEVQASIRELVSYNLVGMFFNLFLPGTTGGDAVRIYDIAQISSEKKIAAGMTVLAERVAGLFALLVLAGAALLLGGHRLMDTASTATLLGVVVACVITVIGLAVSFLYTPLWVNAVRTVRPIMSRLERYQVERRLNDARSSVASVMRHPSTVVGVLFLSCAYHLLSAAFLFLALRSMGEHVDLLLLLPVLAIVTVSIMLPISVQGIGVREQLYVHFLGKLGVPPATVLSALVVHYSAWVVSGLLGGCVFALRRWRRPQTLKSSFEPDLESREELS
jgi:uncharacterized protein (TIRG00374 family)